jgi:CheY-like chemotaxis protein
MSISILVVDDETDVAELFKRKFRRELRNADYVMHFAYSGEEAINMLDAEIEPKVMLVLSDINMPGMSGIELLTDTKKRWPDLPVAMITAYGDPESRQKAYDAGAADFLTKPIDFVELKDKFAGLLQETGD